MVNQPLAYFLTWSCYGTWLHGDIRESVDRDHNMFGTAKIEHSERLRTAKENTLIHEAIVLDNESRPIVHQAIVDHCAHRNWKLFALNVRTTHVHAIVRVPTHAPEAVLEQFKSWSTRRLREAGVMSPSARVWTAHGSTVYLFEEGKLKEKIHYVLHEQ